MDLIILFILDNFQKSYLNKCCCDTNFVGVFLYIATLIDKLDTRSFGGMFSLGFHAVRKDSYIAKCVGKDLTSTSILGKRYLSF
jgi:hypothetical protein